MMVGTLLTMLCRLLFRSRCPSDADFGERRRLIPGYSKASPMAWCLNLGPIWSHVLSHCACKMGSPLVMVMQHSSACVKVSLEKWRLTAAMMSGWASSAAARACGVCVREVREKTTRGEKVKDKRKNSVKNQEPLPQQFHNTSAGAPRGDRRRRRRGLCRCARDRSTLSG